MRITRCLYNSRTALHRVFVSPFEKVEALSRRSALLNPGSRALPAILSPPLQGFARHAALIPRFKKKRPSPSDSAPDAAAPKPGQLPQDRAIYDREVMVVDENNKLTGPHNTRAVLKSLDPETQSLRMVSRAPARPAPDQPPFAICRVIDKIAEKERERAQQKAKKDTARRLARVKELELNWAIAPHDMGHKMKQMKTFLEKGYKVEVLFAKKKNSRIATKDEADALVQQVRDAVAEVAGAREYKEAEGQPRKVMKLYLESLAKPGSKPTPAVEAPVADAVPEAST
ncbi:translation initiation factor IF-3 [Colletotrichum orchidophilum]|uniref:Translation initiation factor IF-3 n=1 Tax=Colletotrichum orchidophilum TaxID=1209926 RepID=A0A1G4B645_9PEZI|nr:translation initiation factor IF-3 [Colletotrichum orchidophilum]OHE96755.1 translation initiation factor IF-3 [Colletotrichum orchidophilum]